MNQSAWDEIYVTDKTGKRVFRETCTADATPGVIRSIQRKLPVCGAILDLAAAQIILNGVPYDSADSMNDEDLLAELLA